MKKASKVRPVKPAAKAKKAKKARRVAMIALAALSLGLILSSGCAVVHGSAGESSYVGWAFGEKASTTLAGLNITETQNEYGTNTIERGVGVDAAGAAGEADINKIVGNLLVAGLRSQGIGAAGPQQEAAQSGDPAASAAPVPVRRTVYAAEAPRSVQSGDGVPLVAVLGNRATCGYCRSLWGGIDASAMSAALCGASIIDADAAASPSDYARYRPSGAFNYPLVVVYEGGERKGQFVARGYSQERLISEVRALAPSCASQ